MPHRAMQHDPGLDRNIPIGVGFVEQGASISDNGGLDEEPEEAVARGRSACLRCGIGDFDHHYLVRATLA